MASPRCSPASRSSCVRADSPLGQQAALGFDRGCWPICYPTRPRSISSWGGDRRRYRTAVASTEGRVDPVDRPDGTSREWGFVTPTTAREDRSGDRGSGSKSRRAFTVRLTAGGCRRRWRTYRVCGTRSVVLPQKCRWRSPSPWPIRGRTSSAAARERTGPFSPGGRRAPRPRTASWSNSSARSQRPAASCAWGRFSAVRPAGQWWIPSPASASAPRAAILEVPVSRAAQRWSRYPATVACARLWAYRRMNAIDRLAGCRGGSHRGKQDRLPVRVSDYAAHLLDPTYPRPGDLICAALADWRSRQPYHAGPRHA